ncbi:PPOX class F420-dependent oxidoreductase [Mycobacterium sp. M26]|uniref:PPOX class F420-dependent oxidoreductase n=1 Tax=Mycobacterium sp. M26 TaxID=1762962 RepID=UPI00073E543F|nr:PPOX class F420-dependent oxidoreductase [Mycobacterium sp. M26]
MSFKAHEIAYLHAADLGRLATMQPNGTLQNSPVSFQYNEHLGTIDVYGYNLAKSQKFRNIATNDTVAFVVDDIFSHDPWRVRCLEIRGTAQQAENAKGEPLIRITPTRIISFGIDDTETEPHDLVADSRDVPTSG